MKNLNTSQPSNNVASNILFNKKSKKAMPTKRTLSQTPFKLHQPLKAVASGTRKTDEHTKVDKKQPNKQNQKSKSISDCGKITSMDFMKLTIPSFYIQAANTQPSEPMKPQREQPNIENPAKPNNQPQQYPNTHDKKYQMTHKPQHDNVYNPQRFISELVMTDFRTSKTKDEDMELVT